MKNNSNSKCVSFLARSSRVFADRQCLCPSIAHNFVCRVNRKLDK